MSDFDVFAANLNLLPALAALLRLRSVTLAAREARVTQSAMSHSLARLRELFDDPLLVASGKTLVLTPRAEHLAARLPDALDVLRRAVASPEPFDPATSDRTIRIATFDPFELARLPGLLQRLSRSAPRMHVDIERFGPTSLAAVGAGDVDIALVGGHLPLPEASLRKRTLLHDPFAVVVRPGHPRVGRTLSLKTYLSLPHALVTLEGRRTGVVDQALARMGKRRDVVLRVPQFVSALIAVSRSDLVSTMAASVARSGKELFGLRVLPPPFALPTTEMVAVWSRRHDGDPAHAFIRRVLFEEVGGG